LLPNGVANDFHRSALGTQPVSDEHLTFMIDCTTKIVRLIVNFYEKLIETPLPV
jgi:hypothetical protein